METPFHWLADYFDVHATVIWKTAATVFVILTMLALRAVTDYFISRLKTDVVAVYNWRKGAVYVSYFSGLLLVIAIWFDQISDVSTFLGLLSAGLAVALKDPIMNLAGWYFVVVRQPFKVGDRVQLGKYAGDVVDVRMFQFTIIEIGNWVDSDQTTGRIVHVPNLLIFSEALFNYSTGFNYIWNEVGVMVTFESDWRKAKDILTEIAHERAESLSDSAREEIRKAAKQYMIIYNKLTPIVYTSVRDNGVKLTIRYLCNPRQRRGTEQQIWEDILDRFGKEPDVQFAYPTHRVQYSAEGGQPFDIRPFFGEGRSQS